MILIITLVFLLYLRTWKYKMLIDDNEPRKMMMKEINKKPLPKEFYSQQRPIMYFITNIVTFLSVCMAIYMIWGYKPALLYSVFPLNVMGGAWSVGNLYMTTVLFILVAYYYLITYTWGWLVSIVFYHFALKSTVSAIPYAFFVLFLPVSWQVKVLHLCILGLFLSSKGFVSHLKDRKEFVNRQGVQIKIHPRSIFLMVKTMGYYIFLHAWPSRLGFFHEFCKDDHSNNKLFKPSRYFWLMLALSLVFSAWAIQIDFTMWLWFILFMGIFSNYIIIGQSFTERYTFIPAIAFCVLMSHTLSDPILYAIYATLLFYRSHIYIPSFKDVNTLFSQSISAFPYAEENYNNYARWLFEHGEWMEAIKYFRVAIALANGSKFQLFANLMTCYNSIQRYDEALYCCNEAMKQCPEVRFEEFKRIYFELNDKANQTRKLRRRIREV